MVELANSRRGIVRLFNLTERLKFEGRGEFFMLSTTPTCTPNRYVEHFGIQHDHVGD